MQKRVLVTGASGYIGQHLLDGLAARGYEVHTVSRHQSPHAGEYTHHASDLLQWQTTDTLVANVAPTHLVHLAWITEPGTYWHSPENRDWLTASNRLLESFQRYGGQRALLAGTCAEYDWSDGHCVEDETPLRATSLYSTSKLAFREAANLLAEKSDLEVAWGRVFFSFGENERPERLVPSVINALLGGTRAKCSDGDLIRDFMYVRDVADAMAAVLDHSFVGDVNIASGSAVSLHDLVSRIAEKLDAVGCVDFGHYPRRAGDPDRITAATSRLNNAVGWSPAYDLDTALDRTIAWWKSQAD